MKEKESGRQSRILLTSVSGKPKNPENSLAQSEDQQSVQEMKDKIDQVITPYVLSGPKIVQGERKVENGSRIKQVPAELSESHGGIPLNRHQVVEHEWDQKRIPICRKRDRGKEKQYEPLRRP